MIQRETNDGRYAVDFNLWRETAIHVVNEGVSDCIFSHVTYGVDKIVRTRYGPMLCGTVRYQRQPDGA